MPSKTVCRALRRGFVFRSVTLVFTAGLALAAQNSQPDRQLVQYMQEAQKLGLKEREINQNAIGAGWTKAAVDDAWTVVRYLSGHQPPGTAGKQPPAAGEEPAANPAEAQDYRIGAGDIIQIVVWREPEASVPAAVVRNDGKISVPLIKEVDVAGLTPAELEKLLTRRLSEFIRGADVTVVTKEIHSRNAYVIGAVNKEGPIPLRSRMTVLQAILQAGGLTEYAKPRKIYVLRTQNGKQVRFPFDHSAVIRGERPEQNIVLMPDDSIVVPH